MTTSIGIVILNYNDSESTLQLLNLIHEYNNLAIVVVDNNSTDQSYDKLLHFTNVYNFHLIKADINGGYSYGNNLGLKYLINTKNVDIAIIANPDIIFNENILEILTEHFNTYRKCGLASPIMLDRNGRKTRMWLKSPTYLNSILDCIFIGRQLNKLIRRTPVDQSQNKQKVDILPGSFLAFSSDALKKMDYLDENVFLYYEENIIGERLKRLGLCTYLLSDCSYIHNHSVTIRKNLSILNAFKCNLRSKLYFEKEYHNIGKVKELFLKAMMKYAVAEMSLILKIRSILKI